MDEPKPVDHVVFLVEVRMLRLSCIACVALGFVGMPSRAQACGGTFCDGGAIPVAQTGETILFVMGEGGTEAHIQIAYDPNTDADAFAWVVPLLSVPTFAVGSQPLFDSLLAGTVPAYGFQTQPDSCDLDDGALTGASPPSDDTAKFDAAGEDDGPEVVLQQTVGAFEITVLEGGTADEVMQWLGDNGYEQDPAAEPILAEYLDEGYMFAAFKLRQDAGIDEIHPIVLEFATEEACVPLRLTRIAAQDDMQVRAFFLADARVVPQNYRHVRVNPLALDWSTSASNYDDVITLAVDAFAAEGKAFVTEFAGPSTRVSPIGIFEASWNAAAFVDIAAEDLVGELAQQSLMDCIGTDRGTNSMCYVRNPILQGLLLEHLPPPPDVAVEVFWGCIACYADMIDLEAWDPAAFAAALEQRIIAPGAHAAAVLDAYPYLTRLFTTISPAEMTEDPFFWINPDLEDVDLTNQIATRRVLCNRDTVWTLPDGREVYVPTGAPWPDFDGVMPYEEEVSEMPPAGAPMVLADRRDAIADVLEAHNCSHQWWIEGVCGPQEGESSESGSTAADQESRSHDGCGCATGGGSVWALVVLGARRRRRADAPRRVTSGRH